METVLGRSGLCKKGIPIPHGKFTLPWSLAREVLLTAAPLSGEESRGGVHFPEPSGNGPLGGPWSRTTHAVLLPV